MANNEPQGFKGLTMAQNTLELTGANLSPYVILWGLLGITEAQPLFKAKYSPTKFLRLKRAQ